MRIVCKSLSLPKQGNTVSEYEDAVAPLEPADCDVKRFRCAVADGATETSFSAYWAQLLVNGYVDEVDQELLKQRWRESLSEKELAWYAEEKANSGAFAALIGLCLDESVVGESGTWKAQALGDSCLIQIRDNHFIEQFPLTHFDQFNSCPVLLCSRSPANQSQEALIEKTGRWQNGDVFYLLSDAIARWTYLRQEEHGDAFRWLEELKTVDQLALFADQQRHLVDTQSRPLLRNDDVTLLRVVPRSV